MMKQSALKGKIALVTGGNRGLGKAAALRLADYGADVIVTYRHHLSEALIVVTEIEERNGKAATAQLDIMKIGELDGFASKVGNLLRERWDTENFDFLINNAGFGGQTPIGQTAEDLFDNLNLVHFKGVYFLTEKLLPLLADNGRIVNLSSGLTRFVIPGFAAYAAMKGAIEVYTKYLAKELGPRGITANAVAPGAIDTDFNRGAFESDPEIKAQITAQTALGRVGVSADIGGVIAFLCSEDARWINAQRIEASGGVNL
jgi:NAD(P)-dependent dehydrogenase (short-subunit alcohol dehydrogenase family)